MGKFKGGSWKPSEESKMGMRNNKKPNSYSNVHAGYNKNNNNRNNSKNIRQVPNSDFFNPYNFIDIDFKKSIVKKNPAKKEKNGVTGILNCIIKTKTKLFVPDSIPISEEADHKTFGFMKNPNGEYIIPGSSLRGTVRSVFEAATDSCFSVLSNNKYLSSRFKGTGVKPGLLIKKDNCWELYQAKQLYFLVKLKRDDNRRKKKQYEEGNDVDYKVKSLFYDGNDALIKDGDNVFIKLKSGMKLRSGSRVAVKEKALTRMTVDDDKNEYEKKSKIGNVITDFDKYTGTSKDEDYLFLGEDCQNRHYSRIFRKEGKETQFKESSWEIKALINTLKEYRDTKSNKNHYELKPGNNHRAYGYITLNQTGDKIIDTDVIPLWYEEKNGKYYLQLAAMGRRSYEKKIEDFITDEVHKPCVSRDSLCEACSLFGMIGDKEKGGKEAAGMGSKIRFSDAVALTPEKFCDEKNTESWYILEILSTPHIYLPFFAKDNTAEKKAMFEGDYSGITNLRGRKFYLHAPAKTFGEVNSKNTKENKFRKNDQNITAQVANEGAEFRFSVYYENISKEERNKLIWSLNFGENEKDGTYCHKIGHGKPIGLGSAKIIVESIIEREYKSGEYKESERKFDQVYSEPDFVNKNMINSVKEICDFNKICEKGIDVHYPGWKKSKDESDEVKSFQWFENNKSLNSASNENKGLILPKLYEPLCNLEQRK